MFLSKPNPVRRRRPQPAGAKPVRYWGLSVWGLLFASGCARPPDYQEVGEGALARFSADLANLAGQLSLAHLLFYAVVLGGLLTLDAAGRALVRVAWRLGFDRHRRLASALLIVRAIGVSLVFTWLLLRLVRIAPTLSALLLPVGLLVLCVLFARFLHNVAAGLVIAFSRRVRHGDRVELGAWSGIVRDIGLDNITLRHTDGSRVHVPNRDVILRGVRIERGRNAEPVRFELPLSPGIDARSATETARRLVLLSPYRLANTSIEVEVAPATRVLKVGFHTWTERAVAPSRSQLLAALEEELAKG